MPLVPNAATYDGTSLVTFSASQPRLVFWCARGLYGSPEVRGQDTVIPGAAGRTVRNRVRDRRVVELEGHVWGVGADDAAQQADLEAAMETLRTLFSPTRSPANLVIATSTGTRTISCRPLPTMKESGPEIPTYRHVSVELEAVGADWA